jgi:hypothetical protein
MVQLAALLLGFPAGYLIRNQRVALAAMGVLLTALLVAQTIAVGHDDRIDAIYWVIQAVTYAVAAPGRVGTPRLDQPPCGDAATGRHPSVTRSVAQGRIGGEANGGW